MPTASRFPDPTRRALVIGSGPAGASAARVLARADYDVIICEGRATPELQSSGLLNLGKWTVDLLDREGVDTSALSATFPMPTDGTRAPHLVTDWRKAREALLAPAIESGARLFNGKAFQSLDLDSRGFPRAHFDDGAALVASLIVGADGRDSAVRKATFPDRPLAFQEIVVLQGRCRAALVEDLQISPAHPIRAIEYPGVKCTMFAAPNDKGSGDFAIRWALTINVEAGQAERLLGAKPTDVPIVPRLTKAMSDWIREDVVAGLPADMASAIRATSAISAIPVLKTPLPETTYAKHGKGVVVLVGDALQSKGPFGAAGIKYSAGETAQLGREIRSAKESGRSLVEALDAFDTRAIKKVREEAAHTSGVEAAKGFGPGAAVKFEVPTNHAAVGKPALGL